MSPVSQIIWRNKHRLEGHNRLLLVRPAADNLASGLSTDGHEVAVISHSCAVHDFLTRQGVKSRLNISWPEAGKKWSRVILFQPRERRLLEMMLALSTGILAEAGELWLAGENTSGIKSAGKRLPGYFHRHQKLDNARHCSLFSARSPLARGDFDLDGYQGEWSVEIANRTFAIASLPGVFAEGKLDSGTALLLEALTAPSFPGKVRGRVLDFGCGSGVIGVVISGFFPAAKVTMLDDSVLAVEAARLTAEKNDVRAEIIAANGLDELPDDPGSRFEWIVSNPPFHSGARQELNTAHRFLQNTPRLLAGEGRLCLVANNHLPYRRWLQELFGEVQVIASNHGYNVWLAHRPRTTIDP